MGAAICSRLGTVFHRLFVGVLRHQFATKRLGEYGLVEFRQEARGVSVFGSDAVEPGEGRFDATDDLLSFVFYGPRYVYL